MMSDSLSLNLSSLHKMRQFKKHTQISSLISFYNSHNDHFLKIFSALFYGVTSFLITVINKTVLTSYGFPSVQFLGLGQMLTIVVVLSVGKKLNLIVFPDIDRHTFSKVWPLPLIYICNMIFGLGGTKLLNLPMYTVLRRFAILMTMIGEFYILNVRPKFSVQLSVYIMIIGAILAASSDLAFNMQGYVYILLNDFFTATNGVYLKQKLDAKVLGKYGLLYYNALFMLPLGVLLLWYTDEINLVTRYPKWKDAMFLSQFLMSCTMGLILNYSIVWTMQYNSALTTTIVGCLKNISVTYLGMVIGGDYIFSWTNFVGLNVSVIGSLMYTYVTFKAPSKDAPIHINNNSMKSVVKYETV